MPGDKKPYTVSSINTVKCCRPGCRQRARFQWKTCADEHYFPLCLRCDVALNHLVLAFVGEARAATKVHEYRLEVVGHA